TVDLTHGGIPSRPDSLEAEEQRNWVLAAVAASTPRQREVIALHYFAGLSLRECADLLEVPSGTVKSRLARGLTELGDRLRGSVHLERSAKSHACDR
ncbi:MAG: sigma-70 family RNA polymerase sigma factor, partial [Planctomycetes bacterium]|nr:sigma-70 family RNA polymerase sigma factor [Planctomycetota bacterium]